MRGPEFLPPGDYSTPAIYEGEVVQVGSGWDGVDAPNAYLWVRLPDRTERRLAVSACVRKPLPPTVRTVIAPP
ncbi:hypothetical protein [Streptomyces sp. NPDC091027]|uniref:hypothetical protein n=1 Tax=Streptomyces sp. NPDC091027 TaxID=3365971 RepID=UPI003825DE27